MTSLDELEEFAAVRQTLRDRYGITTAAAFLERMDAYARGDFGKEVTLFAESLGIVPSALIRLDRIAYQCEKRTLPTALDSR